jgi:hypothetical protein
MNSNSPSKPSPFARELIEKEIEHLKKRRGTRHAGEHRRTWSKCLFTGVVLGLFWLWGMDAVLFSYNRGDAISVYLYLHNYGNDAKAAAVASSGLLTRAEVKHLDARQGSFQDYFKGTADAEAKGEELIGFMQQVNDLHQGRYERLSPLNKLRYFLFIKTGLIPPIRWDVINSSIDK